jgi:hypothetical protein
MSKLVLERTVGGVTSLEIITCAPGAEAIVAFQRLKNEPPAPPHTVPGPRGHKVWCWNIIPNSASVVGVLTYTGAIELQATAASTQPLINAFKAGPTAAPEDVLIYP